MAILRAGDATPRFSTWWSLRDHARRGAQRTERGAPDPETVRRLRAAIEDSVTAQLMSDVPLGVALSGGLDSAVIASVAAARLPGPLHTFSLAFADPSYDEHGPAVALAHRIGAVPHVIHAGHIQLARAIETLGARMDEPLADPAMLPTFLLAEEARRHVKVLLGGEGADELFGGYPTYPGHLAAAWYARIPAWIRQGALEPLIRAWPASDHKVTVEFLLKRFVNHAARPVLERHAAWFGVLTPAEAEALAGPRLGSSPDRPEPLGTLRDAAGAEEEWNGSALGQVMYLDALTFLGEGLLTKLDRVCMACSLESRSPYLGRGVVELAAGLPAAWKVRGLETKCVLRAAVSDLVPQDFLKRRKRGLSVPLARMFRHELRGSLLDELSPKRLDDEGLLDGRAAARLVADHLEHRADRSRSLWALLALVRWYRNHALAGAHAPPRAAREASVTAVAGD
jgi:asparagine synthase (glutamine-hydrolysing)